MPKNFSRAALTILGCLCILLIAEQCVPFVYRSMPVAWLNWDRAERRKQTIREMPDADVLILGDSTAVLSVIPEVFRSVTGLATVNLATYADRDDVTDPFLLLTYLEHHKPPKAVIVVRSILSWDKGYGIELFRQQTERLDLAGVLLRAGVMSKTEYARVVLDKIFPSLIYRDLFSFVRTSMFDAKQREKNLRDYAEGREWLGYEPFDPTQHNTNLELNEKNINTIHSVSKDGHVNFTGYAMPMLNALCETAQENGIHLYLSFSPNASIIKDDPLMASMAQEVFTTIGKTFDARPNCRQFPDIQIMEMKYLSDLTHTNHEGAQVYTSRLAEKFLKMEAAQ